MASKKAKGKRAKTRDLMKRRHSKTTINKLLSDFKEGQNVTVVINPSIHAGLPFRRFQNLSGKIVEKRGSSFVVSVKHGNKEKEVITTAAHLKAI